MGRKNSIDTILLTEWGKQVADACIHIMSSSASL